TLMPKSSRPRPRWTSIYSTDPPRRLEAPITRCAIGSRTGTPSTRDDPFGVLGQEGTQQFDRAAQVGIEFIQLLSRNPQFPDRTSPGLLHGRTCSEIGSDSGPGDVPLPSSG